MWRFGDELASPRQIEARIAELVGTARAAEFWRRFRDEFVTERTSRSSRCWGSITSAYLSTRAA
jgi:hypothetical protein